MRSSWTLLMDALTIIWTVSVIAAWAVPEIAGPAETLATWLLIFFVLDLLVVYKRMRRFWKFLRKEWPALLLVLPWFRIFNIGGLAEALKIARLTRLSKVLRALESGTYSRLKNIMGMTKSIYTGRRKKK